MASRIKHRVEPLLGWLFVAGVVAALGLVLLAATRPMERTAQFPVHESR
jgi:hypothetical protein